MITIDRKLFVDRIEQALKRTQFDAKNWRESVDRAMATWPERLKDKPLFSALVDLIQTLSASPQQDEATEEPREAVLLRLLVACLLRNRTTEAVDRFLDELLSLRDGKGMLIRFANNLLLLYQSDR